MSGGYLYADDIDAYEHPIEVTETSEYTKPVTLPATLRDTLPTTLRDTLPDTLPTSRPPSVPRVVRDDRLKKWIVAVLICVCLAVLLSAIAAIISLANLLKPTGCNEYDVSVEGEFTTTRLATTTLAETETPRLCLNAINFTEVWRTDYNGQNLQNNCDTISLASAGFPWFRFTRHAGTHLLDSCPATNGSCGTHGAIWSDVSMPTEVGRYDEIEAFGSWTSGCKHFRISLAVMKCSSAPHDYIYKHFGNESCQLGFCGMF